jgi:hypothetical protein
MDEEEVNCAKMQKWNGGGNGKRTCEMDGMRKVNACCL